MRVLQRNQSNEYSVTLRPILNTEYEFHGVLKESNYAVINRIMTSLGYMSVILDQIQQN